MPFRLVFCWSSAPWIPGLLPVALHLLILTDIHACIDQCLHCVIQHFHCSGSEWVMPWLSCLVKVLRLSSLSLTPVSVLWACYNQRTDQVRATLPAQCLVADVDVRCLLPAHRLCPVPKWSPMCDGADPEMVSGRAGMWGVEGQPSVPSQTCVPLG